VISTVTVRLSIGDFRQGTLYSIAQVASLFGYHPATIRGWIKEGVLTAKQMPGAAIRVRRPVRAAGRPEYRIDGGEVLRLWGRLDLEMAREMDATPTPAKPVNARAGDALGKLNRLNKGA
jgi:hypothetical protein